MPMKQFLFCILAMVQFPSLIFSQDIIIKKNGDEFKSKVTEITNDDVKYRKWENLTGPVYSISKSEVFKVKYENGQSDFFGATPAKSAVVVTSEAPPPTPAPSKPSKASKKSVAQQPQNNAYSELFNPNGKVTWLGIDFSHVKMQGEFAQFMGAGKESMSDIKSVYFPAWNQLIPFEPTKYDIKGMMKKALVIYDMDMIAGLNSNAPIDAMSSYNSVIYTESDITNFVSSYDLTGKSGIAVLLIAESLNKTTKEAYFHFVALNMATKEILIQERLRGEPKGFGVRNYWAGSIYDVIKHIETKEYKVWASKYSR